jgi:aspartyl-tRNA(Asn)/glutamyl-tRNA(Gln) amidotransferase subunit B
MEQKIDIEFVEKLVSNINLINFFDKIEYSDKAKLAKIFFSEIVSIANEKHLSVSQLNIDTKEITIAIKLTDDGSISKKHLKKIFPLLINGQNKTQEIIQKLNIQQISDYKILEKMIDKIINNNKLLLQEYDTRPNRVLKHLIGLLMKETKGNANPVIANQIIIKKIEILVKK